MQKRPLWLWPWLAHVVLALGGLVVSIILTLDKRAVSLGGESTCGAKSGCEVLGKSVMSEIPGIGLPISLLGAAFYATWLVLTIIRWRGENGDDPEGPSRSMVGRSLMILMGIGAVVYSIVLFGYSAGENVFCKFCVTLYVINAAMLALTFFTGRIKPPPRAIAAGGLIAITAVAFLAFTGAGFAAYKASIPPPTIVDPLANPETPRHTFDVAKHASLGPDDAPFHLVEFADFECPHCKMFYGTIEELLKQRPDKVRVSFMSFPLDRSCNKSVPADFHMRACELAAFGECANRQGKYPVVAAMLYESGKSTPRAELVDAFAGMGLDKAKLESCLADPSVLELVKSDIDQGLKAGVDGTPALFINGIAVEIAKIDYYLAIIDAHANDKK